MTCFLETVVGIVVSVEIKEVSARRKSQSVAVLVGKFRPSYVASVAAVLRFDIHPRELVYARRIYSDQSVLVEVRKVLFIAASEVSYV